MRKNIFLWIVFFYLPFWVEAQENSFKSGLWRASITLQGGEAPFHLDFKKEQNKWVAYILNADERLKLDEITFKEDSIRINLHIFDAVLVGKIINGSKIEGKWIKYGYQPAYEVPFKAEYGIPYRFEETNQKAEIDFSGKWSVTFTDDSGKSYPALGVFKQVNQKIIGTFLTTTGDYRYLEGKVEGNTYWLSTFDGSHGFLFKASADSPHTLKGEFWAGKLGYETFVATRNDTAQLPDAHTLTYLKEGYDKLAFSFPDLSGNMVSLSDEKYKGKVVIVQILGSWCPNCMDETAFLTKWHKKNKQNGVEIIGLAYERSPAFEQAKTRVEKMKNRFKIEYDLLIAGINDKTEASKTLPMLNAILAFPTTILIDRQGKVRRIHTGFEGPGTGKYYEKFVRQFNDFMKKLIAE